jgi:hypothetical protein
VDNTDDRISDLLLLVVHRICILILLLGGIQRLMSMISIMVYVVVSLLTFRLRLGKCFVSLGNRKAFTHMIFLSMLVGAMSKRCGFQKREKNFLDYSVTSAP